MPTAVRYLAPSVDAIIIRKRNCCSLSYAESADRVAVFDLARSADHRPVDLELLAVLLQRSYVGGELGRHGFQLAVHIE